MRNVFCPRCASSRWVISSLPCGPVLQRGFFSLVVVGVVHLFDLLLRTVERFFMTKQIQLGLVAVGALGAVSMANAAADTSAVVAAGTDALAYAAAVAGVLISIWAAKLAYRKFFGG